MNKVEELIQQLCPEGVEYKELGDVVVIVKGKQLNKELLTDIGTYPAYNGGISFSGFTDNYNYDENTIIISQGGASAGFVNFITTKFYANAPCYVVLPNNEVVINRYVYHFLKLNQERLTEKQHGAGIPALKTSEIAKLLIPIPPLPVQQEIVTILDTFTQLEAELEARKKQYEYYRNELLTFGDEVEWKTLGELCIIQSGGTPSKNRFDYWNNGTIKWLGSTVCKNNKSIDKVTDYITEIGLRNSSTKLFKKETTLIALVGATIGKVAFLPYEAATNQNIAGLFPIDTKKLNTSYLFYSCQALYEVFTNLSQDKLKMANLTFVRGLKIPIPPIEEQERIVSILDKFDALVNDISIGLPAEIEARRKQYEYYREKLLSFDRAE